MHCRIKERDVQIAVINAVGNILAGSQTATDETLLKRVKALTMALCEGLEEGVAKASAMGGQQGSSGPA